MSIVAIIVSVIFSILIVGYCIHKIKNFGWHALSDRFFGVLVLLYGAYFALFIGSSVSLVLPGIGSIAVGATAGAALGWATFAILGTLGVATGGIAIALGAIGMAVIGAVLAAVGATAGGAGFQATRYFLVTPWFWGVLIAIGLYLILFGRNKTNQ